MASYLDYLLTPSFVPQVIERPPVRYSTHYKTDMWPPKGDVMPPVDPQLLGLLNTPYDPTQDVNLDGAQNFDPVDVQPLPYDQATTMPVETPPTSGFNPNKTAGFDPTSQPGFQLPPMDNAENWSALGSGGSPIGLLGSMAIADMFKPSSKPEYAPAVKGNRPQALSVNQLLKLYGVR